MAGRINEKRAEGEPACRQARFPERRLMTGFIDYVDGKISLYVFEKKGTQYTLIDTISIPAEDELNQSTLTSLVKTRLEYIYLSIPLNLLSLRELDFPFSDKNKINDTLSYELEGLLLNNTSDYSIDHLITESSENGSRVLAACIEKAKLIEIIDLFSSVGLEPVVITSLDLRLYSGNIDKLAENPVTEEKKRAETALEELISPLINLRQGDLSYKGDIERIRKSLRLTGALVLLLVLFLGATVTLKLFSLKNERASIKKEIQRVYSETFPEDIKIVDASRQFKGNLNALREKKTIFAGIPVLDILLKISNIKKGNIILKEFNIDGDKILVKGTALSFENVDSFKNVLSPLFKDVRVIDSKSFSDNKIGFSIIMKGYDS